MDWTELADTLPAQQGLPARATRIARLGMVRDGAQYAGLTAPFSAERSPAGEYVPITRRRPSVRSGLCRSLVEDSATLVFGEDHFPHVAAADEATQSALAALVRDLSLPLTMLEAATIGSVGSVVLLLHLIDRRAVVSVLETVTLTPEFEPARPALLRRLVQRYQVKGADLQACGYALPPGSQRQTFWFQRVWDQEDETWYQPQRLTDAANGLPMQVDEERSVRHGMGFVPAVWVRNLPGGSGPDGACSFEAAIDTVCEIDYLLSQGGRALKYASDPTLVIKSGAAGDDAPARTGGAATALELPPEGDAKLLEINGGAAGAVLEHVRYLRGLAQEAMHGNRADADRVTAAQSGRAQELMHQSLTWLAGRMRQSYGETGLLTLLRMICRASGMIEGGLLIGDDETGVGLRPDGLELRWPAYFRPTNTDLLQSAQALVTAVDGGIASQETAVTAYAALTDVDDAAEELARVRAEAEAKAALAEQQADAAAVRAAAAAGTKETRVITG